MLKTGVLPTVNVRPPLSVDPEKSVVDHIIRLSLASGLPVNPQSITNLYVGLKSKPLTLLVGPAKTGKVEAVRHLANALIGEDPFRYQMMVGHTWWASPCAEIVQFAETQSRWNAGKILELIQEAGLPENAHRIYMVCLTRISPAELNDFFAEVAFQLQHEHIMRIASAHLLEPIPFPRNFFLVGTMDTNQFKWTDEDLISKTSLIHWIPIDPQASINRPFYKEAIVNGEKTLLRSSLRSLQFALRKLHELLKSQRTCFYPLIQTSQVLQKHHVPLTSSVFQSAMIYIANSWSITGEGLFGQDSATNLAIALDYAIAQTFLLPIEDRIMDSAILRKSLRTVFKDQFPRSADLITQSG